MQPQTGGAVRVGAKQPSGKGDPERAQSALAGSAFMRCKATNQARIASSNLSKHVRPSGAKRVFTV